MSNKVQISLAGVLQDLKDGMTRAEIGAKYGLNGNQTNRLFANPKLKGKKTMKFSFDVVDDAPDEPIRVFEAKKTGPALVGGFSNRTQASLPLDSNPKPDNEPAGDAPETETVPEVPKPQPEVPVTDPGIAPGPKPETSPYPGMTSQPAPQSSGTNDWGTATTSEAPKKEEPIVEQNGLW